MSSNLKLWLLSLSAHVALGALFALPFVAQDEKREKKAITLTLMMADKQPAIIDEVPFSPPTKKARAHKLVPPQKKAPLVRGSLENSSDAGVITMGTKPQAYALAPRRPRPLLLNGDAVQVSYPPKARYLKIEGSVHLRLVVAASGDVEEAAIVSGPAFGLSQAAVSLAKKLRFLPATDEYGNAVASETTHEVIFKLN